MSGSAIHLWRFARALLRFVESEAGAKVKQADIGAECARACGRDKPYHKVWVSRALSAARLFPSEPANPTECAAFTDAFHGNGAPKSGAKKSGASNADDALRGAIAFARLAVKRGMDVAAVETAIAEALENTDTDDADESAAA